MGIKEPRCWREGESMTGMSGISTCPTEDGPKIRREKLHLLKNVKIANTEPE